MLNLGIKEGFCCEGTPNNILHFCLEPYNPCFETDKARHHFSGKPQYEKKHGRVQKHSQGEDGDGSFWPSMVRVPAPHRLLADGKYWEHELSHVHIHGITVDGIGPCRSSMQSWQCNHAIPLATESATTLDL